MHEKISLPARVMLNLFAIIALYFVIIPIAAVIIDIIITLILGEQLETEVAQFIQRINIPLGLTLGLVVLNLKLEKLNEQISKDDKPSDIEN